MIIINLSLNTTLSTDIYVVLEQELCLRLYPITRDYCGPAERVLLVTCRLTCDYLMHMFNFHFQFTFLGIEAFIYICLGVQ